MAGPMAIYALSAFEQPIRLMNADRKEVPARGKELFLLVQDFDSTMIVNAEARRRIRSDHGAGCWGMRG
jgi:hypothetical protein